ncbi:flagellar biosynthesis anti-sigma factor FlgM [Shewanella sp. Choline-02u-19]|jgi:flagellar biosynthesis anti-sigma factor FlgM|uniref:flagellar biosynthesis anti-sigma factor FlgM n=1 Tax=unclassified Shewanella TaxID=196818 RepID=UPI000C343272|nr:MULTISPECIES: flagellar biosynthesis anti-sigma factor FlgM [unclassified Shewanella]PKG56089.1 flagellar biosynthesis anti-sigma factor FlgM [Shewanella sp. GutDb-MelDb]PKH57261.1 flagellar biosynthesis anti-sigma factor FlgM [Shewanella sp. Bg11-22]PKI29625.1 flagellar biosynthesis anti-sigma factor FlgM [Shewanella sp. Choline-02u-19]
MEISKVSSTISADMGMSKSKTQSAIPVPEKPVATPIKAQQEVSEDCRLLEHTKHSLEQLPDFDLSKVEQLRQSLVDGSFELNLEELAETMVQQHG